MNRAARGSNKAASRKIRLKPKTKGKNYFMTTATMAMRRNQNLYRSKAEIKLGPASSGAVIIAIIAVLALLYLNAITKTSVFGYQLTQIQQQNKQAQSSKQELEVEAARLTSIREIQSSNTVRGLVPTTQVTYAK